MSPEGKTPKPVRRKAAGIGDNSSNEGYLDGQLLIAMPVMGNRKPATRRAFRCVAGAAETTHMFSIITWPKPEHDTCVAPCIRRAKS